MLSTPKRFWKNVTLTVITTWRILKLFMAHAFQWKGLGEISLTRTEGILQQGGIHIIGVSAPGCHRIRIQGKSSLPGDIGVLLIWLTQPSATMTVQFHGVFQTRVAALTLSGDCIKIQKPESPELTLPIVERTDLPQAQVTAPKPLIVLQPTPHVQLSSVQLAWPSFTIPRQFQPPH